MILLALARSLVARDGALDGAILAAAAQQLDGPGQSEISFALAHANEVDEVCT